MTSLGAVASGLLAYSGAGSAYTNTKSATSSGSGTASSGAASTAATNVTLSAAAMAALATQDADASTTFATVTANARTLLDQLMAQAGVTSPLNAKGEATIDLSGIDGRTLFAAATNSQGLFSTDEQTAAAQEIQNRFDAYLKPRLAASDMTGNYTDVYKAQEQSVRLADRDRQRSRRRIHFARDAGAGHDAGPDELQRCCEQRPCRA
jgi:hypothetical protein